MITSLFRRRENFVGTKRSALDLARGRLVLVSAVFALAYILVAARVTDLSLIQGHLAGGTGQGSSTAAQQAVRADITDRNGVLLATSLETASLYADPSLIDAPETVAKALVKVMPDLVYGDVLAKLQRKGRFVWIKRNIKPQEQYEILQIGEPGLAFQSEWRRLYPQGPLASHIVGHTDVDGRGLAGIERSFDRLLSDGGGPLKLSLDIRLQHILRRETKAAMTEYKAIGAAGIIMDIASGDILAAVSLPDFDPNDPGASAAVNLFNRTTLGVYEPGSTGKIFSTAAYLEFGKGGMGAAFDAREPLKRGRFTISDYHAEKRVLSLPEVFMHSSNIGAALMGEAVGTDALKSFYGDLGLLDPAKIEIDEIGHPLYPKPWRDINTLTAAFGHGVAMSPLQVVTASASIVGDGTLVRPTLIADDSRKPSQKRPDVRIVSPQTAHRMRQLMRLVVAAGTGDNADVPGYEVGGKTGTAEKSGAHGGYDTKRLYSSFMGFFPMNAPRYAVYIVVDEPKGTKASFGYATGGWVAAPAVAKVIANMVAVLGIPPAHISPEDDLAAALMPYVHDASVKANEGGASLATY